MSKRSNKICPVCEPQTVITTGMSLCEKHRTFEYSHIVETCKQENLRAIQHGLIGDLTAEQFVVSTRYFAIVTPHSLPVWACAYCGVPCAPGLDHWNPISRGGSSTFGNVIPCCLTCNVLKSAKTGDEFLDYMIHVWQSPIAAMSKGKITLYWQLVEQGIEEVYQYAMGFK